MDRRCAESHRDDQDDDLSEEAREAVDHSGGQCLGPQRSLLLEVTHVDCDLCGCARHGVMAAGWMYGTAAASSSAPTASAAIGTATSTPTETALRVKRHATSRWSSSGVALTAAVPSWSTTMSPWPSTSSVVASRPPWA